jgi:hypothetical protein
MIPNHTSPKFNLNGNLLPPKPDSPKSTKKDPWPSSSETKTLSDLHQKRKKALLPDPSFDLDKDGFVGNLDLFISKRFDKDQDGKLNKEERECAEKALNSGFLSSFKLGLERKGPTSQLRMIQKRGVIIENDDISSLKETYPIIRHSSLPSFTSRTQLLNARKSGQQTARPIENVFRIEVSQPMCDVPNKEPKFTSAEAIKAAYRNSIREKMGMTEPKDIKNQTSLGLEYVEVPKYPSQSLMNQMKKKELLGSLHENANYDHVNREKQLLEREKFLISHKEGKTLAEIKEKKRLETNEYNQRVFSNIAIGVHGKELPKFTENIQEYWKVKDQWVEHPNVPVKTLSSPTMFKVNQIQESQNEFKSKSPPYRSNPLKPKQVELTDKPNHIIPYGTYTPVEITDSSYKIPNIKYRMSTIFGHFLESAAEMGINFLPLSENLRTEKLKNHGLETSIGPASEVPKTSQSIMKKQTARTVISSNPLRTTGFTLKRPEEN